MNITIYACSMHTKTLTGGDKIFVECAKRWIKLGHRVEIVTNEPGVEYCCNHGLPKNTLIFWKMPSFYKLGVYIAMISKTLFSLMYSLLRTRRKSDIVFASSFFFPDMIPAIFDRLFNPRTQLLTGFYIFSKKLLGQDYSGGRLKGCFFYINQMLSLHLIKSLKGKILTASDRDRKFFVSQFSMKEHDVYSVRGGVDNAFFSSVPSPSIQFDAVFVGRFHPQKCIDELIDLWSEVVKIDRSRTLILIGGGPQEKYLRKRVCSMNLKDHVLFMGIQDGVQKIKLLKSSKIFVSASRHDTGNIALDEALACGVPGIIYDLPDLDYPKGVVKVPVANQNVFREKIVHFLTHDIERRKLAGSALAFAKTIDWDQKAFEILKFAQGEYI